MNSDYIRSLPPQVKKRINALKNLQKKHMETEVEFHKEFHMLELKYQEKMSELTQQVIQTQRIDNLSEPRYNLVLDPDGEIENSGKSIFEIWIQKFCYIQVIVFDFSYLSVAQKCFLQFFHGSGLASCCHW